MTTKIDTDGPFDGLIGLVASDVKFSAAAAKEQGTEHSFRNAVRAVFAGAEAIVWYIKSLARRVTERDPTAYSPFETAALKDETYTIARNGKVVARPNFVPLGTSLRLVVSLLSRGQVSDADLVLDQQSMATLEESLKVRHRLTHPKSASDMTVTAEDFHRSILSWAVVLTVALNAEREADMRLGTKRFPISPAGSALDSPAASGTTDKE